MANQTGVTVRTLHHYDEIGLLVPSLRTSAGHRGYSEVDVQRLHRILALRGFGLSLAEIGRLPAGIGADPRDLTRKRQEMSDQLPAAELAELHRRRAALMPRSEA